MKATIETDDGRGRIRKRKTLTQEAVIAERLWKKGAIRIWSKHLRDAIGLILGLAASDQKRVFQRTILDNAWDQVRSAVQRIRDYGAWQSERVSPVLGGNVIGEIEAALNDWADYSNQLRLDAYYLVGRPPQS